MQYEFKHILDNIDLYAIERLNDTIIDHRDSYQVLVQLDNKMTMPGFATELKDDKGSISKTLYFIDKEKFYPNRIKGESYSIDNPEQKAFIEQRYYDIKYNISIDEFVRFNTTNESLKGFKVLEMKPE